MNFRQMTRSKAGAWASSCVLMIVLFPGRSAAQGPNAFTPSANPVSDAVRNVMTSHAKSLIASAELMPADKYGYQPTAKQMTFGALMAHVIQSNMAICSALSDTPPSMGPDALKKISGTDAKEALVTTLKQSFDYCSAGIGKVQDAGLREEASVFGRKTGMSRAEALVTIAVDWADHYSTAASYLRLNGILPPTAKQ